MHILLILLPLLFPGQTTKFVRVKASDEISLRIPEDFVALSDGAVFERHGHYRGPVAFYTDPMGEVDFSISQNASRWREQDIEIYKDFYKSNILSLHDDVEFFREEVRDVRGQQFAVFEFVSMLKGDEKSFRNTGVLSKYTYILYTVYNGTTIIFNFTSEARNRNRWTPIVNEIMAGITLK